VNLPKVDDYSDYLFLVVHGIRFDAPTDQFETRELDIFLGPNYLVTHHKGPMRSITSARELCAKDLQIAGAKGADFLLHQILDRMFENYFPSLDAIEDKMQLVQVEVFENPTPGTLDRIFTLKRDVMQLRRICTPEREILHRLSRGEFRVVSPKAAIYFRDIYDNLYRIVDASYSYQDMAQGTLDAYLSAINNRLNETMKRLTVLTVVLASLTVITGVYGMNFEHMPELGWRFGYLWALALMVVVPGAIVVWARRKKGCERRRSRTSSARSPPASGERPACREELWRTPRRGARSVHGRSRRGGPRAGPGRRPRHGPATRRWPSTARRPSSLLRGPGSRPGLERPSLDRGRLRARPPDAGGGRPGRDRGGGRPREAAAREGRRPPAGDDRRGAGPLRGGAGPAQVPARGLDRGGARGGGADPPGPRSAADGLLAEVRGADDPRDAPGRRAGRAALPALRAEPDRGPRGGRGGWWAAVRGRLPARPAPSLANLRLFVAGG
jgi:magnesium transporter